MRSAQGHKDVVAAAVDAAVGEDEEEDAVDRLDRRQVTDKRSNPARSAKNVATLTTRVAYAQLVGLNVTSVSDTATMVRSAPTGVINHEHKKCRPRPSHNSMPHNSTLHSSISHSNIAHSNISHHLRCPDFLVPWTARITR